MTASPKTKAPPTIGRSFQSCPAACHSAPQMARNSPIKSLEHSPCTQKLISTLPAWVDACAGRASTTPWSALVFGIYCGAWAPKVRTYRYASASNASPRDGGTKQMPAALTAHQDLRSTCTALEDLDCSPALSERIHLQGSHRSTYCQTRFARPVRRQASAHLHLVTLRVKLVGRPTRGTAVKESRTAVFFRCARSPVAEYHTSR
jgi:hypothetical protein